MAEVLFADSHVVVVRRDAPAHGQCQVWPRATPATPQPASRVLLFGLVSRSDLNGVVGYVLTAQNAAGRFAVRVGIEAVLLKPANLVVIDEKTILSLDTDALTAVCSAISFNELLPFALTCTQFRRLAEARVANVAEQESEQKVRHVMYRDMLNQTYVSKGYASNGILAPAHRRRSPNALDLWMRTSVLGMARTAGLSRWAHSLGCPFALATILNSNSFFNQLIIKREVLTGPFAKNDESFITHVGPSPGKPRGGLGYTPERADVKVEPWDWNECCRFPTNNHTEYLPTNDYPGDDRSLTAREWDAVAVPLSQLWLAHTGVPWMVVRFGAPEGKTCFTVRDLYRVIAAFEGASGVYKEQRAQINDDGAPGPKSRRTNCFVSVGPPTAFELRDAGGSVEAFLNHVLLEGPDSRSVLYWDYGAIESYPNAIDPDRFNRCSMRDWDWLFEPKRKSRAEISEISRGFFTMKWSYEHKLPTDQWEQVQYL